jgi:hypothetical protein
MMRAGAEMVDCGIDNPVLVESGDKIDIAGALPKAEVPRCIPVVQSGRRHTGISSFAGNFDLTP